MLHRASLPIMVLALHDNHDAAVAIPAGETFEAVGFASDDRFTIVNVKGEEFLVFTSDLKQCEMVVSAQLVHPLVETVVNG